MRVAGWRATELAVRGIVRFPFALEPRLGVIPVRHACAHVR